MKMEVRERILADGADLVHRKGFNNTGIQEILKATGVPKGSFYFYFKNKEEFGLSLIDYYGQLFAQIGGKVLMEKSISPMQRLKTFFASFHGYFEEQGFSRGCPIGNLAQEMGDLSPAFAAKLTDSIDSMASIFSKVLHEAKDTGEVRSDLNPEDTGYFMVAAWHGALVRMKVTKSREPLDLFERMIFQTILV